MNYTNPIDKMMKSLNFTSSIEKSMRQMHRFNSMHEMAGIMGTTKLQNALFSVNADVSLRRIMKTIDYTSSIQKAISSLNDSNSLQKMMKSMDHSSRLQNALTSSITDVTLRRMIKSMDYTSSIQRAISSLNHNDSMQRVLGSLNYEKTINNLSKSLDVANHMQRVGAFLAKPNILEQVIAASKSENDFDPEQFKIAQEEFSQSITPLSEADDDKVFVSCFLKLPPVIRVLIIFFFLQIFLPQINNIVSNILTPYVQEIIHIPGKTNKELVKEIKKIPVSSFGIDVSKLRFITGTNVRLRQKSSTNSPILDELDLGQIVEVVSKKRNWIKVKVTYDDECLIGWVFNSHTAKFKK